MATLTAIGRQKPAELVTIRDTFLDGVRGSNTRRAEWLARTTRHIEAHKRMVPMPPPER